MSVSTDKRFQDTNTFVPRIIKRGSVSFDLVDFTTYGFGSASVTIPEVTYSTNHIVEAYIGEPNTFFLKLPDAIWAATTDTLQRSTWFEMEDSGNDELKLTFYEYRSGTGSRTIYYVIYSSSYV